MLSLNVKITGVAPLLMANPQTVDRFNPYAKAMARINAKKTRRTDDDYLELADLEVRSKLYFAEDIGVYVPTKWLSESIAVNAFRCAKVSKLNIRGAVFMDRGRVPLTYRGMELVATEDDIVGNPMFRKKLILPQGQVRVCKSAPIFHDWSFEVEMEYDEKIIDPDSLAHTISHAAKYNGFGDFRPTFGRGVAEITHL